jgi:Tol biopolymer transport system component
MKNLFRMLAQLVLLGGLMLVLVVVIRSLRGGGGATQLPSPIGISPLQTPYPAPLVEPSATRDPNLPYPPPPLPTLPPEIPPTPPPTETLPPFPTEIPTPLVTAIPIAKPPFIPLDSDSKKPFTIIFRKGNVIQSLNNDGKDERILLDVHAKTSLFLGSEEACGTDVWGAISPDGKQLALVLCNIEDLKTLPKGQSPEYSIYLFDIESGILKFLVPNGVEPVWSPDGNRIAYRGKNSGLWLVDSASGISNEIYSVKQANEEWVTRFDWSPDGKQLVFVDEIYQQSRSIVKLNTDQAAPVKVLVPPSTYWPTLPKWSPDGTRILFISEEGKSSSSQSYFNIWIMDSDGSNHSQITFDIQVDSLDWSPDGNWIAFSGAKAYELLLTYSDLWIVNKDGNELKRLTSLKDEKANLEDPKWSPDGAQIVYKKNNLEVWVLSLLNGKSTSLNMATTDYVILSPIIMN